MRWMKLEPIIQSEVSEKKNTNTVYKCIYGILKDGTSDPICETAKETQR